MTTQLVKYHLLNNTFLLPTEMPPLLIINFCVYLGLILESFQFHGLVCLCMHYIVLISEALLYVLISLIIHERGEGQREKQAPHGAGSLTRGSIPGP